MKAPGAGSNVNYTAGNPRLSAMRGSTKTFKLGNMFLTAALLFTVGGIAFTMKWNSDRQKDGTCIDCARQRKMMDEIYSNETQPRVQKGYRL